MATAASGSGAAASAHGLVFWEKDHGSGSADDLLFNVNSSTAYRTDTAQVGTVSTNAALDDQDQPIVGAAGLMVEGACECPQGLYGGMFNDDFIFNATQDSFYRVI